MPWIAGTPKDGTHIWDHEPHRDTPALCGEWLRDMGPPHKLPMPDMPQESLEEWLETDTTICEECHEAARELYL